MLISKYEIFNLLNYLKLPFNYYFRITGLVGLLLLHPASAALGHFRKRQAHRHRRCSRLCNPFENLLNLNVYLRFIPLGLYHYQMSHHFGNLDFSVVFSFLSFVKAQKSFQIVYLHIQLLTFMIFNSLSTEMRHQHHSLCLNCWGKIPFSFLILMSFCS